nr:hypothetical protein CFP56_10404 [Quercus suber]
METRRKVHSIHGRRRWKNLKEALYATSPSMRSRAHCIPTFAESGSMCRMSYEAPPKAPDATVQPVAEGNPRMVTRLAKLGPAAADVDCPYCKRVVKTEPRKVSSGDDG